MYWAQHPVVDGPTTRQIECAWSPPFQSVQNLPPLDDHESGEKVATTPYYKWLAAAKTFSGIVSDPANMFETKLQPGQCVLFDNRRILHGRRQFNTGSGRRWLKGTYVAKQTFLSKLQQMPPDTEGLSKLTSRPDRLERAQVSQLVLGKTTGPTSTSQ